MPRSILKQSSRAAPIAAILAGLQSPAAAQSGPGQQPDDGVRLEYRAPPECPDSAGFSALVRSRLPAGWEASGKLGPRFEIEVSGAQNGYLATLELVDERGERVTRAVRGEHCASVADAIALVTALAIQSRAPGASNRSEPALAPANEPAPTPPPESAPKQVVAAPKAARTRVNTRARREPSPTRDQQAAPTALDEPKAVHLRLTGRAALSTGVGPNAAPGAALGIVFEWRSARLGAALQAFRTARVSHQGVPVRFELLSGRLEACPFVVSISESLSIEPCPFAELGAITGEAFEEPPVVVRGDRGTATWLASGASGRAVGRFGAFVVELEAGFGIPLARERFYIEGRENLYRVPAYYGAVSGGAGVRF